MPPPSGPGLAAVLLLAATAASGQDFKLRTSLRAYGLSRVGQTALDAGSDRDAEFLALRFMPEAAFGPAFRAESHLVLKLARPASSPALDLVNGQTRTFADLDHVYRQAGVTEVSGNVDRLNVRVHTAKADLTVGRQAITWGVNILWPALDLFSPLRPARLDRDYKPGVDAVRLTVPLAACSELQVVGAVLGDEPSRDRTAAALVRFNAGRADLAAMGGSFHGDTVLGGFATASAGGTVLRAELAWTRTGPGPDQARVPQFWRGGVGVERQLSPSVNLMVEVSFNGFGESDPADYPAVLSSDHLQRGEAVGLGRRYAGTSLAWRFHPLGTFTSLALLNVDDRSALWIPSATWSLADSADLQGGAEVPFGPKPVPGGILCSEYGSASCWLFLGLKVVF